MVTPTLRVNPCTLQFSSGEVSIFAHARRVGGKHAYAFSSALECGRESRLHLDCWTWFLTLYIITTVKFDVFQFL